MAHGNISVALQRHLRLARLYDLLDNVQYCDSYYPRCTNLSLALSVGSSWETLSRHVGVSRYVENAENESMYT